MGPGGKRQGRGREDLVGVGASRPPVAGDRMQPPLQHHSARAVPAQPHLRTVDVGIHRLTEAVVEGHDHLRAGAPHRGGDQAGQRGPRLALTPVLAEETFHLVGEFIGASQCHRLGAVA